MGQNCLPAPGSAAGPVPGADERPEQTRSGRGCAAAGVPEVGPRDARARAVGNSHCCPPRLEKGGHNRKKIGTCQEQKRRDFFFIHVLFSSLQERYLGPRCLRLDGAFGPESGSGLAQALNPEGRVGLRPEPCGPCAACEGRNSRLQLWHGPHRRNGGCEGQAQRAPCSGRMTTPLGRMPPSLRQSR